jgi:quercetin dioxygenase-like cupin family protein
MKNFRRPALLVAGALMLPYLFIGAAASGADAAKEAAVVKPLLTQDLTGVPGKEALLLTVEYLPGGASLAHRHDADVFVYVLEGSIIMQVDGQEPKTLGVGQTFHEGPGDIHRKSANASATQPAKFIVFIVKDKGKPTTRPVTDKP